MALQIASDPVAEKSIWQINAFTPSMRPDFARKSMLATIYLDMGELYSDTNFHIEALSSYKKSLALAFEINDHTIPSVAFGGQVDIFINLNQLDSAETYVKYSLQYGDSANYMKYRSNDFLRYGTIERMRGNLEKAKEFFHNGLWWSIDQYNVIGQGELYVALSNLYLEEGALDSAYYYARASLVLNQGTYYRERILASYNVLYLVFKLTNLPDSAFHYLEKAKILTDSINSERKDQAISKYRF